MHFICNAVKKKSLQKPGSRPSDFFFQTGIYFFQPETNTGIHLKEKLSKCFSFFEFWILIFNVTYNYIGI